MQGVGRRETVRIAINGGTIIRMVLTPSLLGHGLTAVETVLRSVIILMVKDGYKPIKQLTVIL